MKIIEEKEQWAQIIQYQARHSMSLIHKDGGNASNGMTFAAI